MMSSSSLAAPLNKTRTADVKPIRLQLDPMRLHEPARSKLSTVETQRIMVVFDDLVQKMELIEMLPVIVSHADLFKNIIDTETMNEIYRHEELKQAYETNSSIRTISNIIEKLPQLENYTRRFDKSLSYNANEKIAYHYYIQQSIRNVLRRLLQHNRFDAVKHILKNNNLLPPPKDLMRVLKMLRDSAMERFLTTPLEEREKVDQMKNLSIRLSSNEAVIAKLEKELNDAVAERDAEIKARNDEIRKIQSDLNNVERNQQEMLKRIRMETESAEVSETKNSEGRRHKLQMDINACRQKLQEQQQKNKKTESDLRKEKWRQETGLETWLTKYDNEMRQKQDEYDEIETAYTEEKRLLIELEERFEKLKEEYDKIMAERDDEEKRLAMEKALRERRWRAAGHIQRFWLGYKVRKGLKAKKKKKGKKSGKSKK
ncbi:unnamed protein product [Rotaria magnacalcarata]|uniref:Dynein regulatory complex protein 10 n=1 Tax=Rotaria magnacalcarata TaxID=392030 RepID=A0A8S2KGG5_9BILA|nr:unnamed protein product [Rotaria magnacalcarata]CAF3853349.1 unnamed protein product [Rotaria magnacalcarata]CAF3855137.1 unnamed protein product [Rotaria magnacalcarata]